MDTMTIVTVLRDGRHVLHQLHTKRKQAPFAVAAHLVMRQRHYGTDAVRFVIVCGAEVTVEDPRP